MSIKVPEFPSECFPRSCAEMSCCSRSRDGSHTREYNESAEPFRNGDVVRLMLNLSSVVPTCLHLASEQFVTGDVAINIVQLRPRKLAPLTSELLLFVAFVAVHLPQISVFYAWGEIQALFGNSKMFTHVWPRTVRIIFVQFYSLSKVINKNVIVFSHPYGVF